MVNDILCVERRRKSIAKLEKETSGDGGERYLILCVERRRKVQ